MLEEGRQLVQGEEVAKLRQLAGIEIQIGQLNRDLLQGVILSIDKTVELGLRPMERVGYPVPSALHGLDLHQQHLLRGGQQPVYAPLNAQGEIRRLDFTGEAHLLLIAGRAGTLEPLMPASSRQGAVRPDKAALAAEVALPQGELDQLAHLHREDWFG